MSQDATFDAIFQRIKHLLKTDKDARVAEALGVKGTHFAVWRSRNHIPYEHLITFCQLRCIPLDYVILGIDGASDSDQDGHGIAPKEVSVTIGLSGRFNETATIKVPITWKSMSGSVVIGNHTVNITTEIR